MFLLKQILPAAIISMMMAAGVCALASFWKSSRVQRVLDPLGMGLAYSFGHVFVAGWPSFPPKDTTNWLPCFALVIAILSVFWERLSIRAGIRLLLGFLVSIIALRLLLKPRFEYGWSPREGYVWVSCLAIAMVLVGIILATVVSRSSVAIENPMFSLMLCGGSFGVLALSGSLLLGQFAAILGGSVLGSALFFAKRKENQARGDVPVFALLLSTLLLSGYFFAELPAISAALIAFAPILALIPMGKLKRAAFPVRIALVSVPILIALILAFQASPPLTY